MKTLFLTLLLMSCGRLFGAAQARNLVVPTCVAPGSTMTVTFDMMSANYEQGN